MRVLFAAGLLVAAVLGGGDAKAQAIEVANVRYEPSVDLAGQKLQLNGAGIRYKFVVKVYTAGLYLTQRAGSTQDVLAAPGPKRIEIHMLRDIDGNELGKLFTKGMEDNATPGEFAKCINGVLKLGEVFANRKKLSSGDAFSVDYVPGVGSALLVNGKSVLTEPIKEPEFFSALLRIWLGNKPADDGLKDALLGIKRGAPRR